MNVTSDYDRGSMVATPFVILTDVQEKAAWRFTNIRARSFIDKDQRIYVPRTERRYLGIGAGDYSLAGYEGRVGIERKSCADFQGTLLGWPATEEMLAQGREVHRRGRFKNELLRLARYECKAVIVEATLPACLQSCPSWGVRSAGENAKYLFSTYLAWQQEFPGVPWLFAADVPMAELIAMRMFEQFWNRTAKERKERCIHQEV